MVDARFDRLQLVGGPVELAGALGLESGPDVFRPWRLPPADVELYHPALTYQARCASGVRLRWRSDATAIELHVEAEPVEEFLRVLAGDPTYELVVDGELWGERMVGDGRLELEGLPGGMKDLELWLANFPPLNVISLAVSHGARVEPPTADRRPGWVVYGSSITHGAGLAPTKTWPAVASRLLGRKLTSLGFAGNCHFDPIVARGIAGVPAAWITLKLGINVHGAASLRERTFLPAVYGFIGTIRDVQPTVPITIVSPVFSPSREQSPISCYEIDGQAICNEGDLTLEQMRSLLAESVEILVRRGDRALSYVDGLELLGPAEGDRLPDGLHPDEEGLRRIGERYVASERRLAVSPGGALGT